MSIYLLTMLTHLLIVVIHLLTIPNCFNNFTAKSNVCANSLMIGRILLLIQPIPLIAHLQISTSQIPNFYNYYSWIDLLIICSSIVNTMLTKGSSIFFSSSLLRIYGFYMSQFSTSTFISKSSA